MLTLLAMALAAGGCTGGADSYEPNDELQAATPLAPGTTLRATIDKSGSQGDQDIFECEAPKPDGGSFRIEIRSDRADSLKVQVGASIPTAWEAISWPAWRPRVDAGAIVVEGELKEGTVLIFVSGEKRAGYSIRMTWQ